MFWLFMEEAKQNRCQPDFHCIWLEASMRKDGGDAAKRSKKTKKNKKDKGASDKNQGETNRCFIFNARLL